MKKSIYITIFLLVIFNTSQLFAMSLSYTIAIPNITAGYGDHMSDLSDMVGDTLTTTLFIDDSLTPADFAEYKSIRPHQYGAIGVFTTSTGFSDPIMVGNGWAYIQTFGDDWNNPLIRAYLNAEWGSNDIRYTFDLQPSGDTYGSVTATQQWMGVPSSVTKSGVPEPTTMLLLGLGLMGLAGVKRKLKK